MANDLKLRVLLDAVDKITAPLRAIHRQSGKAAQAMNAARERLKGLNAAQKQIGDFRQLKQGLLSTSAALDNARTKTRELGRQLALTPTPTKAMRREFEQAKLALERLKQQEVSQSQQLNQLRQGLKATGISTRNLGEHERRLKQQMLDANRQIDTQRRRLEALTQQQRRLAQANKTYQQGKQMAGNLAGKGAAGLATGGAALYGGARLLVPGVDFDASMSKTQAITRLDKGSEDLKALRDQARELGGSTMFTAGQASDAQGFLGMAGFDPKAIKAAMPGMLNLAAAGGAELAETADIASNIMSGLGMTADQMDKLGDVLVGTFTRANTDLRMLGETMKYAAPMARTYGVDLETAAAMAGKLGDAGLQGSMGGTALSSIMNRLAAPPKAAAKALDKLKIQTADAQGNLRPLPDILKEIHDKTANMGTAAKGGLFKAIAGEEAVKGMAQLVDQAGSGELQKLIATLRQTQGEANKTAKVMADNLKGDITTLKSAWADLGIEIEEQQDGVLRDLVKSITEIIGTVKNWARENPVLAGTLVKIAAGIALTSAVLGTLALTVASILGPFVMLRFLLAQVGIRFPGIIGLFRMLATTLAGPLITGLRAVSIALWGLAANPVVLAIAAIVAVLAGAAYLIYRNWDTVKAYFSNAWEEIKAGFSSGIGGILNSLANFSPLGLVYQAFAAVLSYLGIDLPNRFTEFGNMIVNGLINGLFAGLGQIKDAITSIGDSTIGWFKEKLGIHSPSRVFAELGGFTMAGLTQGLESGQQGPLNAMTRMSKQLTAAGNMALGGSPLSALTIDDRPPISSRASMAYDSHDTYEINIHPTAGMDAQAIGRAVRAEMTRAKNEQAARRRSRLSDSE
ncbi:phage tail tape measure protein [Pseudomonas gingeri]|uniref:phage tail tape measure protein n=1 Tax=Pseudomonas gingeri TaxID=117681 RepID=UPI0015A05E51|nr:phage tail tape measure protein [Pseudomonas gingeri]NWD70761.1 phage tail tape measure protein [Pseudomonas gingeri]